MRHIRKTAAGILALLAVMAIGVEAAPRVAQQPSKAGVPRKVRPVGVSYPSVPVQAAEGAAFVGSQACRDCHVNEYREWSASGHANMLRPVSPGIVKGDFGGVNIAYEGVEVEAADKGKTKISPTVRTESRDGVYVVTLVDADNPANNQTFEVVEVLGSLWEQQYYLKVGNKVYPSPVRWVEKDAQWRKAAFASFWWVADGTADGRPRRPEELPAKQTVDYQCNGCHTTAFTAKKDDGGNYSFARQEGGIGCEVCHGPGGKHVAAQGDGGIINPARLGTIQQAQLCGQCHSRVTSKADKDFAFPLGYKVGQTDLQDRVEFWTYSTKPANFWPNEDAKKNRQQYHDTMRSGHMRAGVACSACHLDHATEHRKGSLRKPREQLCADCHTAQQAMFQGSVHAQNGVTCVDCHMSKMANRAGATQKTPKEPFDVTAHTMLPVLPAAAEAFKMRSSCDACHAGELRAGKGERMEKSRQDVLAKVGVMQARLQSQKPVGAVSAKEKLNMVLLDGSLGAHNPARAMRLLDTK